jgi:hypothetical protein
MASAGTGSGDYTFEERVEHLVAAISAADVVGYGRLVEGDEERTLGTFAGIVASPLTYRRQHGGRIFKVMREGLLHEFISMLSAFIPF